MNESDDLKTATSAERRSVLRDARNDFAQFYRSATSDDATAMDALVLAEAALVANMSQPTEFCPPLGRVGLQRADKIDLETAE